jgi:hypothetical protein
MVIAGRARGGRAAHEEVLPRNGLRSSLVTAVSSTDTHLTIEAARAADWPPDGEYRAVLWVDPTNGPFELVKVVGGQGTDTLTVERAAEVYNGDGAAYAWVAGTRIAAVITEEGLEEWVKRFIRGVVWHTGNGPPPDPIPGARSGDLYLDLLTGDIYLVA